MTDFEGLHAIVTGAGNGIGAATVQLLASRGASVGALDLDETRLGEQHERWRAQGLDVTAHVVDLRRPTDIATAIAEIGSRRGRVDVLANVAGVVRYGRADGFSEEDWDFVLDTNLKAAFLTFKEALPFLRLSNAASVVNVASVQAIASQQSVAAYSASKGGLVSLTRSLALDHAAEAIRVNAVLPGSVETPMLRQGAELFAPGDPEAEMKKWGQLHPLGFLAQPQDIAEVIAFLASAKSRVMTGSIVAADEGLLAKLAV